ncbi:hypothetical protein [Serratia fonticola]
MDIITRTGGQALRCEYHPELNRLIAVWQQTLAGEVQRVRYQYNEAGQLVAVQHRGDAVMRRFGWMNRTVCCYGMRMPPGFAVTTSGRKWRISGASPNTTPARVMAIGGL